MTTDDHWTRDPEARAAIMAALARIEREATFDDGRLLEGVLLGEGICRSVFAVGMVKDIFKAIGKLPQ